MKHDDIFTPVFKYLNKLEWPTRVLVDLDGLSPDTCAEFNHAMCRYMCARLIRASSTLGAIVAPSKAAADAAREYAIDFLGNQLHVEFQRPRYSLDLENMSHIRTAYLPSGGQLCGIHGLAPDIVFLQDFLDAPENRMSKFMQSYFPVLFSRRHYACIISGHASTSPERFAKIYRMDGMRTFRPGK